MSLSREGLLEDGKGQALPQQTDKPTPSVSDGGASLEAGHQTKRPTFVRQVLAILAVVGFGCANCISKQIASKPMTRFTYMLGVSTAVVYVPLYGSILFGFYRSGAVPRQQLDFVWKRSLMAGSFPILGFFAVAALGDTLGDIIGTICTPYVAGPTHSLISNSSPIFIMVLSFVFLKRRYSLLQCIAMLGVLVGVAIGVAPSFSGGSKTATDPFYAIVLVGSCVFSPLAFVVKELLFDRYNTWVEGRPSAEEGKGLHVFVVITHAALFQLPFTLLCMPLNQVLGQTHGQGLASYVGDSMHCLFSSASDSCGVAAVHGEDALLCTVIYVVFNVLWNISVITSVKLNGALATFVALKAMFPISTILFGYVDWPLLGITPLSWLMWLSVAVVLPSVGLYQVASIWQQQRHAQHSSLATCCWPFGSARPAATPTAGPSAA